MKNSLLSKNNKGKICIKRDKISNDFKSLHGKQYLEEEPWLIEEYKNILYDALKKISIPITKINLTEITHKEGIIISSLKRFNVGGAAILIQHKKNQKKLNIGYICSNPFK